MALRMPVEIPLARRSVGAQLTSESPLPPMQVLNMCIQRTSGLILVPTLAARVSQVQMDNFHMLDQMVPVIRLVRAQFTGVLDSFVNCAEMLFQSVKALVAFDTHGAPESIAWVLILHVCPQMALGHEHVVTLGTKVGRRPFHREAKRCHRHWRNLRKFFRVGAQIIYPSGGWIHS